MGGFLLEASTSASPLAVLLFRRSLCNHELGNGIVPCLCLACAAAAAGKCGRGLWGEVAAVRAARVQTSEQ
ncbi:hypothetical protein E2562_018346 [Oryza meyeriana var. granulata]|uniref:Uncharacterized protein n=1 Tax=Oryza meyeriana var. granulata TaxID=110450 RepID=A0A6G1D5B5_9ORYZ|nr:hypothetical protein E2562_018346 [Oryza meyeriana var. granulata]